VEGEEDVIPYILLVAAKKYPQMFNSRIQRIRKWNDMGAEKVVKKMLAKSMKELKEMSLKNNSHR
jgi:hypothetical protein